MTSKQQILFSIVIPIFKVEKYLSNCIISILQQDFDEYEIILVDDGSPDNCPTICDEFASKYSNVIVIHKPNGGLSSARNAGVEIAQGDYIIFVDSDDYWEGTNNLSLIQKKIISLKKVDVIIYNNIDYSMINNSKIVKNRNYDEKLLEDSDKETVLKYLFNNGIFPGAAWVTVTRRDFLLKNKIKFIEGIKGEDIDWLLNVFLSAKSYSSINKCFYVYRKYRYDSITGTADKKTIDDIIFTLDIWVNKLKGRNYSFIKDQVLGYLANHYLSAVLVYADIKEEKEKYKKKLNAYKTILKYSNSVMIRLSFLLPIDFLGTILKIIRKIRKVTIK